MTTKDSVSLKTRNDNEMIFKPYRCYCSHHRFVGWLCFVSIWNVEFPFAYGAKVTYLNRLKFSAICKSKFSNLNICFFAGWEVSIVKNCDQGLENAARGQHFQA